MNRISLLLALCVLMPLSRANADAPPNPYSMVYYCLTPDETMARVYLQSLKDLGVTRAHALVYWWQAEPGEGDWWKKDYSANTLGENHYRALDLFVNICHELGITPSLRLGSDREWNGLWHPADPSKSIEPYAAWVTKMAARYRGKVDHYVIGDEENAHKSAKEYMENMHIPLAKAIRAGDPDAGISTCALSSAPAMPFVLELIKLGLPKYADGIAGNFWYTQIDDLHEITDFMKAVRKVWPKAKFYSSGMGYAEHRGIDDMRQAAIVAQCMFNLWDIEYDSAPYYLYQFSMTVDTKENYGIASLPTADKPLEKSAAWKAFQTIAHIFRDRKAMHDSKIAITTRAAAVTEAADGTMLRIAPPAPYIRAFEQGDELFIYLTYRNVRWPRDGRLEITLGSDEWTLPKQIPLLDYTQRQDVQSRVEDGRTILTDVPVATAPTILVLQRKSK